MSGSLKLAVLTVVLGLAYASFEYYEFHTTEVSQLQAEAAQKEGLLEGKRAELRRLQSFVQNIEAIKKELRSLNGEFESALEFMPRTYNLSGLLRKLTLLSQNSGLELYSFKPLGAEERVPGAFYSSLPVEVHLRGPYTSTLLFLDQLSKLKRIVSAEEIIMGPESGSNSRILSGTVLNTTAKIKAYRLSE